MVIGYGNGHCSSEVKRVRKNVSEFIIFLHTFENWKSFEPEIRRWESFVLFFNPNMKNNVDCYGNDFLASQAISEVVNSLWLAGNIRNKFGLRRPVNVP